MKANIYDVAELAGVSITTVSRVLNNSTQVQLKTREKVLQAMEKLDYYPNLNASGLALHNFKTIGALLPRFDDLSFPDSYTLDFLTGIQAELSKYDYNLMILNDSSVDDEPAYVKMIYGKKIDGFIAMKSKVHNDGHFHKVGANDFPVVLIGDAHQQVDEKVCSWNFDLHYYDRLALKYLYNYGHENIGVIYFGDKLEHRKNKLTSIAKACDFYGLPYSDDFNVLNGANYRQNFFKKICEVLKSQCFTAFYVDSVYYARRIAEAAQQLGYQIPHDISIICIEYAQDEANRIYPPITSIYVSGYYMGQESAKMLFELMTERLTTYENKLLEPDLIERGSVKHL